ncbi:peptidyl-alpha-hydroxyglycine alpha-amidating lyase family protein [Sphingomonas quercus]|uniref:Peptidyl-alpha-hydroxyglycine alpha-amidating lyase family protein n=1 Tax=Sphingomonas quercus TaxID=2842451 RepID=A0ABS6BEP9_9SPHN|nr:peptidyl-alpha-hydroxyglycine alpha-amidating lyase family protein [Sphingomonas quercus]MBU3076784.1 peptidyl-alpha-hydroxyglycine alpha-amidating lyase family protein [Sphingomonas quercus]
MARIAVIGLALAAFAALDTASAPATDPNGYANPYKADAGFFKLPPGRTMGSSSAVAVDSKGHIWIADRCGANDCSQSGLDPIMEFDARGNFIKAFGGGRFAFPHGLFIDARDNLWLTDTYVRHGKGGTVTKMSPAGEVLLVLGKTGVSAVGPDTFLEPTAVLVTPAGTVFVTDGHDPDTTARVMKFDAAGKLIKQWGALGRGPGQLNMPHALALDSKGRLFVGDRDNDRIQIYDQDGKLLDSWKQFSRPSGVYIDARDMIYVADSESRTPQGYGHHPGWKRGIRVGSARSGAVTAFIPDDEPDPDARDTSGPEGVWADREGVVYGAEVRQKRVVRHAR